MSTTSQPSSDQLEFLDKVRDAKSLNELLPKLEQAQKALPRDQWLVVLDATLDTLCEDDLLELLGKSLDALGV